MKTRIIKIGNSQGIRIPKSFLKQSGLGEEVELEVQNERIIIRPAERPRQTWEAAFRSMAEQADDRLLDEDLMGQTPWDQAEWPGSPSFRGLPGQLDPTVGREIQKSRPCLFLSPNEMNRHIGTGIIAPMLPL